MTGAGPESGELGDLGKEEHPLLQISFKYSEPPVSDQKYNCQKWWSLIMRGLEFRYHGQAGRLQEMVGWFKMPINQSINLLMSKSEMRLPSLSEPEANG